MPHPWHLFQLHLPPFSTHPKPSPSSIAISGATMAHMAPRLTRRRRALKPRTLKAVGVPLEDLEPILGTGTGAGNILHGEFFRGSFRKLFGSIFLGLPSLPWLM